MKDSFLESQRYNLNLADGSCWTIVPQDAPAARLALQMSRIMQLQSAIRPGRRLRVASQPKEEITVDTEGVCILRPLDGPYALFTHLLDLSDFIARQAQKNGAVLLHG